MKCGLCGRESKGSICHKCFMVEFTAGFYEKDEEIRRANPHTYYSKNSFWDDVGRAKVSPKPPWPKPEIFWLPDYNGWRVKDTVTEGYVDVPVEAVEAMLGRGIESGLRARVLYRHEIEECAKRLLILLIYGCPPKLCAPKPEPPTMAYYKAARDLFRDGIDWPKDIFYKDFVL